MIHTREITAKEVKITNEIRPNAILKTIEKCPTRLEATENRKRRSLNRKTLNPELIPPMQDCRARATDSSVRGKDAEEKETTRKNSLADLGLAFVKCTIDSNMSRT